MENKLDIKITPSSLMKFALPTMLSSVFMRMIVVLSVITFICAFPLAKPISLLYADGVVQVINMSVDGIFAFSVAFLLMGVNMFASLMFTALNDGKTSAILALFRTLVFLLIPLLILPGIIGITGVWIAPAVAETFSLVLSVFYIKRKKSIYNYA